MTDLEQQLTDHLRRRAAAAAPRYDLEAIEQHSDLASLVDLDHRRSRPRTIGLLVMAACLLAVIALAAVVTRPPSESPTTEPSPIRPMAMPSDFVDAAPIAQRGTGRVWVGVDPDPDPNPSGDGHGLGVAYTDDGGATWTRFALPEEVRSTSDAPSDLRIAADGDRVAVIAWWGGERRAVYVSDDAGRTWTTATPSEIGEGNGARVYVLADGRLKLEWSVDAHLKQVFVSTGPDWADLAEL
jgi:hypothetical protein